MGSPAFSFTSSGIPAGFNALAGYQALLARLGPLIDAYTTEAQQLPARNARAFNEYVAGRNEMRADKAKAESEAYYAKGQARKAQQDAQRRQTAADAAAAMARSPLAQSVQNANALDSAQIGRAPGGLAAPNYWMSFLPSATRYAQMGG